MKDCMKLLCTLTILFGALYLVLKLADRFCGKLKRSYTTID